MKKKRILIVGFGNEFCGDDALGPLVVGALNSTPLPKGVEVMVARQLDFTWAEVLAGYQHLIFVDASPHRGYPLVKVRRLDRGRARLAPTTHQLSVGHLLQITQELFGQKPSAHLVAVGGENFDFGGELSLRGRRSAPRAIKKILSLIKDLAPAG